MPECRIYVKFISDLKRRWGFLDDELCYLFSDPSEADDAFDHVIQRRYLRDWFNRTDRIAFAVRKCFHSDAVVAFEADPRPIEYPGINTIAVAVQFWETVCARSDYDPRYMTAHERVFLDRYLHLMPNIDFAVRALIVQTPISPDHEWYFTDVPLVQKAVVAAKMTFQSIAMALLG